MNRTSLHAAWPLFGLVSACSAAPLDEPLAQDDQPLSVISSSLACPWVGKSIVSATPMSYVEPARSQPSLDFVGTDLGNWFHHGGKNYVVFGDATRSYWTGNDDAYAQVMSLDACPKLKFITAPGGTGTTAAPFDLRFYTSPTTWWQYPLGANETSLGSSDGSNALAFSVVHRRCAYGCLGEACDATGVCVAPAAEGGQQRSIMVVSHFLSAPSASSSLQADALIHLRPWQSVSVRAVPRWDPATPFSGAYRGLPDRPDGEAASKPKLFVWGKPSFVAPVQQPTTLLYFDLNEPSPTRWQKPMVFTGLDSHGVPRWAYADPAAPTAPLAAPVITAASETIDGRPILVTGQLNVTWIPELARWLMVYGGRPPSEGSTAFAADSQYGFFYRSAPHPWGPWTAPARLWDARSAGFYDPGQPMYHPGTNASMQNPGEWPVTAVAGEYAASVFAPLTEDWGSFVRIRWAMSIFKPYRVLMMQTDLAR